ncbi:MAG TPA: PAS domain S-box protein [Solirubrobacteraceae bacterium]|nr:PAS domain S-box protein [Solirubrobacteraceae bacterium]
MEHSREFEQVPGIHGMRADAFVAALLSYATDAIAVSDRESGRYLVVSESYCALTGYSREELVGRTSVELGLVADASARSRALSRALAGEMHELRLRRKDGDTRLFEFSVQHLDGGLMLTISRDVTERRRIEAQLRESEERFRVAVGSMLDAFAIMAPVHDDRGQAVDFRFEYINGAYCAMVGLDRDRILGRRGSDLFPDFTASERFAAYREVIATGEPQTIEDLLGAGSALRVVEINVVPLEGNVVVSARDITERREAEAELALRAELLELAHDAVIVCDPVEGRVTFWNRAAETVYGYSFAEAAGRVIHELLATVFPVSKEAVAETLERDGQWRGELGQTRKDGTVITVSTRQALRRDPDGRPTTIIELNSDITERSRVEHALRESEERFRLLAENSRDVIRLYDADRTIRYASPSCETVLGYRPEELVGHASAEFQHPRDAAVSDVRRESVIAGLGDDVTLAYRSRRKDGGYVWLESNVRALRDAHSGSLVGYQESARDISERRVAEAEIRRAKDEAEEANRAKSEFLSRMSHELRTPLHAILGFGELLEREELRGGQRDKLGQMIRGADHLLALINEALDLTAIERGELRLSLEPVHVGEVVGGALELIAPLAAAQSLTLSAPEDGVLDHHVMADRQRLKQVLLNLLSNAVKYNREAGSVAVACAAEGEDRYRIEVADSGVGIASENLVRLFEPFDRLGAEATEVQGTGLGLALTRRLIEAMNGEIGVDSELGRGTMVWLELPVADAPMARPSSTSAAPPALASRGHGQATTVLYIEDNPSNIRLVETILGLRPEVTLMVASQGSLGLELAREHQPSLVLLDLNLPDISGEEVLRRIRAEARTADIPVVMLSADATPGQVERLKQAGADDYLTKPFGFEQFLDLIDSLTRA